jgi:hypothetical protein
MSDIQITQLKGRVSALEDTIKALVVTYGDKDDAKFMQNILDIYDDNPSLPGIDEAYNEQRSQVFRNIREVLKIKLR